MSQFLHRLGARAIGQARIAPRAQSLFEPASAAAPEPMGGFRETLPPARSLRDASETRTQPAANPNPPAPVSPMREPVREQAIASGELPRFHPTRPPNFEREPVNARSGQPHVTEKVTAQTTQTDDGEPSTLTRPTRTEPAIAREQTALPALVATQPLPIVVPRSASTNRPGETGAQGTPANIEPVRVTIGRVEVRAVLAPQPQRTVVRTTPPSLPLDDYLRNRGKA